MDIFSPKTTHQPIMKTSAFWVLITLLFSACGPSTYLTHTWHSGQPATTQKRIVVLALVNNTNQPLRAGMEQQLAAELKNAGFDAVCACDEYDPRTFDNLTPDQAVARLKNAGAGSVLTVVMLGKSQRQFYIAGDQKNPEHDNRFFGYYKTVAERIYSPGYYVNDTRYFWESNFYNLDSNALLYTARSKSADPVSIEKMGNEYGKMIVKDMIKNQVLGLPAKAF